MATASIAVRLNAITGDFEKAFTSATRTVSGFEREFGSAASSIQAHQNRMTQAFSQFSGDRITRDAAALASAIEKVGGASKLTAAEQRNVNATITEAIEKYRALGQQAPASLTALANATKQVEEPTTRVQKSIGFLQSTFAQFTAANLAANALQNVASKLGDFAAQGAKLPGLQASFQSLTSSIGQDSAQMLSTLQESTRGLVSNIDLMQSANKAILLGLPVTNKEMGDLAKTATVLGKAMGQDATKSLDDLITALGRSSPLILDNLGLTVKIGEANDAYAAKLGKTVEQLTEAEKKTAFYEAAMEAARRKVQELGEQSKTLGEISQTVWVSIGNVVTEAIAELNTGIGAQVSALTQLVTIRGKVAESTEAAAKTEQTWRDEVQISRTQVALALLGLGAYAENMRQMAESAKAAAVEQANLNRALANAPKPEQVFQFGTGGRANQFGRDVIDVTQYLKDYEKGLDDAKRAAERHAEALRKVNEKIADLKAGSRAFSTEQKAAIADFLKLGLSVEDISLKLGVSATQVRLYADEWRALQALSTQVIPRIKASVKELIDSMPVSLFPGASSVKDAIPNVRGSSLMAPLVAALERDFAGIDLAAVKASDAIREFGKNADENTKRAEQAVEQNLKAIADHIDAVAAPFMQLADELPGMAGDFAQLGVAAAAAFAKVAAGAQTATQAVQSLQAGAYGLMLQLGAKFFRDVFGQQQATPAMRQDFEAQFGGRANLEFQALLANASLRGVDRDQSAARFQREADLLSNAITAQQEAMERYNLTWRDFGIEVRQSAVTLNASTLFRDFQRLTKAGADAGKVLTGMSGDLSQLIVDAVRTGTRIPGALQPMLESLIRSGQLSDEAARALLGIADDGVPALEDIRAAAERYGLELDALGPKVQQLRINETAKVLIADWNTLIAAGADVNVVAEAMKTNFQAIVTQALTTGLEVPEAMRPILQTLLDMGLLTDENGLKLENLDRINFGVDLKGKIDELIEKLGELIDAFLGVGDAADVAFPPSLGGRPNLGGNPPSGPAIPRPQPDPNAPNPGPTLPPDEGIPVPGGRPNPNGLTGQSSTQFGTSFTTGDVIPTGTSSGLTATFVMNVDGRTLAEATVPYIPGEVQRFGLA